MFYDSGVVVGLGFWGGLDLRFWGGCGFGVLAVVWVACGLGLFRGSSGCFWRGGCNIAFSGLVLFSWYICVILVLGVWFAG